MTGNLKIWLPVHDQKRMKMAAREQLTQTGRAGGRMAAVLGGA